MLKLEEHGIIPENLSVLVVDDHDQMRKAISRVLQKLKIERIVECSDGSEALSAIEQSPVDLLVLDLYMRNIGGFEVLTQLRNRQLSFDIPVIVVTGEASKEDIVRAADLGADEYLLKPFIPEDLEKKVLAALKKTLNPSPLLQKLRLAEKAYFLGSMQEALTRFEEALGIDPTSTRAMHGKALTLHRAGRGAESIALLDQAIAENPSYHKNYALLATLYNQMKEPKRVIDAMRRELEINSRQPLRHIKLAKLLLAESDLEGAVKHMREALKINPKLRPGLMGMGHIYARMNNLEKALYYFKRVRRYHPDATMALEAMVKYCCDSNEPKRAELALRDEKNNHPDRLDTYFTLSKLYFVQERKDEGFKTLDELLARQPENIRALQIKATMQLQYRDFESAAATFRKALDLSDTAKFYVGLAECEIGLGKAQEAIKSLNEALTLEPANINAHFLMAEAHMSAGQFIKAYFLLIKAASLGGDVARLKAQFNACLQSINHRRTSSQIAS